MSASTTALRSLLIAGVLAYLTNRFVEEPLRKRRVAPVQVSRS